MGHNKHNIHRVRCEILRSDPAGLFHISSLTNISYIDLQSCEDTLQVKQHGNYEVFER